MALTSKGSLYGWTAARLLVSMAEATSELDSGKARTAVGSGDVSAQMLIQRNAAQRVENLKANLYNIYVQSLDLEEDDEEYGAYDNYADFFSAGCNEARAQFS